MVNGLRNDYRYFQMIFIIGCQRTNVAWLTCKLARLLGQVTGESSNTRLPIDVRAGLAHGGSNTIGPPNLAVRLARDASRIERENRRASVIKDRAAALATVARPPLFGRAAAARVGQDVVQIKHCSRLC